MKPGTAITERVQRAKPPSARTLGDGRLRPKTTLLGPRVKSDIKVVFLKSGVKRGSPEDSLKAVRGSLKYLRRGDGAGAACFRGAISRARIGTAFSESVLHSFPD